MFGTRHLLSYGGNFRHNNFDLSFAPRATNRDEGGAYVQDAIFLSDHFRWIVGTRVDRFDVLKKAVISPRTTFLMKPRASQTFRLSFNRAFRAPSFVNSFFETGFLGQLDLGSAGRFQFPWPPLATSIEEEVSPRTSRYRWIGRTPRAALYLYRTKNMIQFTQSAATEQRSTSRMAARAAVGIV